MLNVSAMILICNFFEETRTKSILELYDPLFYPNILPADNTTPLISVFGLSRGYAKTSS